MKELESSQPKPQRKLTSEQQKELEKIFEDHNRTEVNWFRSLASLSAAAIAILAAFGPDSGGELWSKIVLTVAWLGMSFCVLFGSLVVYDDVRCHKAHAENTFRQLIDFANGKAERPYVWAEIVFEKRSVSYSKRLASAGFYVGFVSLAVSGLGSTWSWF